jgi:hypothetical protein
MIGRREEEEAIRADRLQLNSIGYLPRRLYLSGSGSILGKIPDGPEWA